MWLMKKLLTSVCTHQRRAGQPAKDAFPYTETQFRKTVNPECILMTLITFLNATPPEQSFKHYKALIN